MAASFMQLQRHGWGIHVVNPAAGGARLTEALPAACGSSTAPAPATGAARGRQETLEDGRKRDKAFSGTRPDTPGPNIALGKILPWHASPGSVQTIEPGLVRVPEWRSAMAIDARATPAQIWAGVALKP